MVCRTFFVAAVLSVAVLSAAAQQPAGSPPAAPAGAQTLDLHALPGTDAANLGTIRGNALDSNGASLPNSAIRLRDARTGRIVGTQVTDDTGGFVFRSIDPGTYVVEVIGADQRVLAASQLLNVSAGESISAVVKLPFKIPPLAGFLGHTAQSAALVIAAAASAEILAVTATHEASPQLGSGPR
ncbi:MAG: carboxypeptidase regulatory-like domain-containing protein [Acidobacteria bacterium]|nr:carboxypeptidase regulatory-like domain-containing protein [Acidobacteriota bacterium]